jgi:hypothetical protein
MEHFGNLALDSAQHKPLLHYIDDTLVVWPHGPEQLQNFLSHLNNLGPTFQFTTETESDSVIPFLVVLVTKKMTTLFTKVYRKPKHNG